MSEERLKRILTGQVYPAMLAQAGPAASPEATLRLLLRALARLMAEARGLLPPKLTGIVRRGDAAPPEEVALCLAEVAWPGAADSLPGRFADLARDLKPLEMLTGFDLAAASPSLPGQVYTDLMPGRKWRGSYYTPQALAEVVARQTLLTSPSGFAGLERPLRPHLRPGLTPGPSPQSGEGRLSGRIPGGEGEWRGESNRKNFEPRGGRRVRVVDPAMGSGDFLIAAGEIMAEWIGASDPAQSPTQARKAALGCLHGVDTDPIAVELAAISLWLWAAPSGTTPAALSGQLACGDALLDDALWKGALAAPFDAVIGNPPYSSAIARARTPDPERLAALRERYHTARGSFDLAVPFTELAVRLCRAGGRCGLVLPNKFLSAEYARPLRAWLAETVTVEAILDASRDRPFQASVYPVACVFRKDRPEMGEALAVYRHQRAGLEDRTGLEDSTALETRGREQERHRPALETPGYELSCRLEADSISQATPTAGTQSSVVDPKHQRTGLEDRQGLEDRPALETPGYELSCRLEADSPTPLSTSTTSTAGARHALPLRNGLMLVRRGSQAELRGAGGNLWSGALDPDWEALRGCWEGARPLDEAARLVSGLTVGEAYRLRPAVFDAAEGDLPEGTFQLVTSGLVRRYGSAWGRITARYLGQTYRRPALLGESLPRRRQEQAAASKIIVAGLGQAPRALVDRGQMQASVGTTVVIEAVWPLDALCAVLNSQVMGRLCRAMFGGLALGGGHMRFGKPELARIPLPDIAADDPRLARLDRLAARRASLADPAQIESIEEEIEALVRNLYHVGGEGQV